MAGTLVFDKWQSGDGSENFKCKAWVNFNGTGTVAIRASGNVSSITDNGVGDYTVNFTTAMPDVNYGVVGSSNLDSSFQSIVSPKVCSINNVRIKTSGLINSGSFYYPDVASLNNYDSEYVNISIFR